MTRHQGNVGVVNEAGALELRCTCGWTEVEGRPVDPGSRTRRAFGRASSPLAFLNAMTEHYQELHGADRWDVAIAFGWDDEAPSAPPRRRPTGDETGDP